MMKLIHIHPDDNVAVALSDIRRSESVTADGVTVMSADDIQRGHKIALRDIPEDTPLAAHPCVSRKRNAPCALARPSKPCATSNSQASMP